MDAKFWKQMEFDKHAPPFCVEECERIDSKALHHSVASRNPSVGHDPTQHVGDLALKPGEIPEVVVLRRTNINQLTGIA